MIRNIGIFIDANSIPETGGGHTYLYSLVEAFNNNSQISKHNIFFIYDSKKSINKDNKYLNAHDYQTNGLAVVFVKTINKICRFLIKKNIFDKIASSGSLNKLIKKNNIDFILFALPKYYEDICCPYIYTVWDLGHRTITYFPEVSTEQENFDSRESMYAYMIPRASYVITGNQIGAGEISKYYNYDQERIIQLEFFTPENFIKKDLTTIDSSVLSNKFGINKKFIFYPAQFWSHKNHIVIMEALKILKGNNQLDCQVVFSGSDKGNLKYIQQKIKELNLQKDIIIAGFVSEEELINLYKSAEMMVFASLLGPNNLPPLEAMVLGCPVLLSDIPGHREQCKDLVEYFKPLDPTDLARKITELINNKKQNLPRINQAKKFALENTVYKYIEQIENIFDKLSYLLQRWK